jgi:hypothetical protein
MAKLPYAENASISSKKLTDYLLSTKHPVGKSKAKFFLNAGFNEANVEQLKERLLYIGRNFNVESVLTTQYGKNYVIKGQIIAPNGLILQFTTVWFIKTGTTNPTFVTAYPT